jgi:hypothetical protein
MRAWVREALAAVELRAPAAWILGGLSVFFVFAIACGGPSVKKTKPVGNACPVSAPVRVTAAGLAYASDNIDYAGVTPVACFHSLEDAVRAGYRVAPADAAAINAALQHAADLEATVAALRQQLASTPPPIVQTVVVTATPPPSPVPTQRPSTTPAAVAAVTPVRTLTPAPLAGTDPIGGSCPVDAPVKVSADRRAFATDHPNYASTVATRCFESLEAAAAGGAPAAPVPPPPGYTFGDGQHVVGTDVIAGAMYRNRVGRTGCYWERTSGFGGSLAEILANDNTDGPP